MMNHKIGSPKWYWKSVVDYQTLYIRIDFYFIFLIWFQWYQFYVDHLSSSEVMVFVILNFCPSLAHKMQIREILRFKVPPESYVT